MQFFLPDAPTRAINETVYQMAEELAVQVADVCYRPHVEWAGD